jgi:hypothetical protein
VKWMLHSTGGCLPMRARSEAQLVHHATVCRQPHLQHMYVVWQKLETSEAGAGMQATLT